MRERPCRCKARMSRKPLVVMNAVGKPLRSRTALVATVDPCARSSIAAMVIPLALRASKAPSSGARGTLGTLVTRMPSGPMATKSVNVPPTSMPTRMPAISLPGVQPVLQPLPPDRKSNARCPPAMQGDALHWCRRQGNILRASARNALGDELAHHGRHGHATAIVAETGVEIWGQLVQVRHVIGRKCDISGPAKLNARLAEHGKQPSQAC